MTVSGKPDSNATEVRTKREDGVTYFRVDLGTIQRQQGVLCWKWSPEERTWACQWPAIWRGTASSSLVSVDCGQMDWETTCWVANLLLQRCASVTSMWEGERRVMPRGEWKTRRPKGLGNELGADLPQAFSQRSRYWFWSYSNGTRYFQESIYLSNLTFSQ